MLLELKNDPNIILKNPKEIHILKHGGICGNGVLEGFEECDDGNLVSGDGCSSDCVMESMCQFASSASASSENSGSLAIYAIGAPDAPKVGTCSSWGSWSGYGYSWSPANWNIKANLTLSYDTPVYVSNFTIIGDYDICWSMMWLKNSVTEEEE